MRRPDFDWIELVAIQCFLHQHTCQSVHIEDKVLLWRRQVPEDGRYASQLWHFLHQYDFRRKRDLFNLFAQLCELCIMAVRLVLQQVSRLIDDHRDGHFVLHSPWDDNVSDVPLWLDVLQEGGLHEREPLLDSAFDRSSSFTDIADNLLSVTSVNKLWKPGGGQGITSAG